MASMIARVRNFVRGGRSEAGAELIELALVTPIFLLLVAGIIDFGMLFRSWEVVTNAAREGARIGVLPAYSADESVRVRVESYMQASGAATACTLSCAPGACSVCVFQSPVTITGVGTITTRVVTVRSDQSLPSLSGIATFFGGSFGTITVSGSSAMRVEEQAVPTP